MAYYIEKNSKTKYATGLLINADEQIDIDNYIPIDEKTYQALINEADKITAYKITENNELILDEDKYADIKTNNSVLNKINSFSERITELKRILTDLDYIDLKYLEGCLSKEEFMKNINVKQSYRDEINDLENQIACLSLESNMDPGIS